MKIPSTDRQAVSRRRALSAIGAGTGLVLGGCESVRGLANPELPVWANHPGGALSVAFRVQLTDVTKIVDQPYERGKPGLDVKSLRVFVPSQDGGLYAVDARSGEVLWRFATLGPVQSEPLYDPTDDSVYFGSTDGALYKVGAKRGELKYRFASSAEIARSPVIVGDNVYFTNANDTLVAIDRISGKLKYFQHHQPAFGLEVGGHAGVSHRAGKLYTAFSDGNVMAYATSDGSELWPTIDLSVDAQSSNGQAPQYLDCDTTPTLGKVAGNDAVIVCHFEGGAYALEGDSGRILWHNPAVKGAHHNLLWHQPRRSGAFDSPERQVLIVTSGQTGIWGLNPNDGSVLWRKPLPEGGVTAPQPIAGGLLFATTRYGVFFLEPTRGAVIDGIEPGNEISMAPAGYGQHAFVVTQGGQLVGLTIRNPRA